MLFSLRSIVLFSRSIATSPLVCGSAVAALSTPALLLAEPVVMDDPVVPDDPDELATWARAALAAAQRTRVRAVKGTSGKVAGKTGAGKMRSTKRRAKK